MPKPNAAILSIVSGLLLLTVLPGCARLAPIEIEKPVPVAVPVKDMPPAELLACAERPIGLPEDADLIAQIPTKLRAGIIRMARAFGANANRLDRLIDWSASGTCARSTTAKP